MRTIAFLTHKGGAGKTTLAASLAVAAPSAGEKVIALDLDPQASLLRWGKRREAAKVPKQGRDRSARRRTSPAAPRNSRGAQRQLGSRSLFSTPQAPTTSPLACDGDRGSLPSASAPNALGCGRDGSDFSGLLLGEAESRIRPQSVPADLPQFASERRGKRPNAPWSSCRAYVVCTHRFSGCDCRGPRCYRVRPRGRAAQEIEAFWIWVRAQFSGTQSRTPADNQQRRQAAA